MGGSGINKKPIVPSEQKRRQRSRLRRGLKKQKLTGEDRDQAASAIGKEPSVCNGLKIANRAVSELRLDPRNPRAHSPRQIKQIARSIEAFGFNVPVLVDSNLKVIAGHGRVLACQKLGRSEVPTICLDHLTEAQARAFMIADNRLTENSVWDETLLAEQLKELSLVDLDLEVIGFDVGEIDLRIQGLDEACDDRDDPADAIPASAGPPVSRPGDLWLLHRNRVYVGSALDPTAYNIVMENRKAGMVFTDPPYNVPIAGNVSGLGAVQHRDFVMGTGEMTEVQFTSFLNTVCALLARFSVGGSLHYVCMDWRHMGELLAASRDVYTELKNACVWVKNHTGMGGLYRSRHELVFVLKNGREAHRNNVGLGRYGRDRTNVWNYPSPRTPSEEGNLLALHPTVKPVAMVADAIMDCTARGDIVLDPFLGSGTTVVAAERTGRCCFGIEIAPVYMDVIVRRWQQYTRDQAVHATSGRCFDEIAKEREDGNGR